MVPRRICYGRRCCPTEAPIELRQLRYFVRIVELGSLSRAAGALHVAQSALSQHVATLEGEFGTPLLNRSARGVTPTEAGRHLYQHAQSILRQVDDTKSAVSACTSEPTGLVAFGLPLSLVAPLALPIFLAVRARYPGVKLLIHEELSGTILEWIKNGRLSLGIAFDDGNLEGLSATPLLEERLFLVVSAKSPLARRKLISLREVADLELVLPTSDQGVRDRIERAMARAGHRITRVVAEVNSLTLMKQAAGAGIGATILSWPSIEAEVAQGTVAAIDIARPAITRRRDVHASLRTVLACQPVRDVRGDAGDARHGARDAVARCALRRPGVNGGRVTDLAFRRSRRPAPCPGSAGSAGPRPA
jgi:LysR family nitrogen assimilation transcriptional regulator